MPVTIKVSLYLFSMIRGLSYVTKFKFPRQSYPLLQSIMRIDYNLYCSTSQDFEMNENLNNKMTLTTDTFTSLSPTTIHSDDDSTKRQQLRDIDDMLIERALRFHDPNFVGYGREPCILIAVDSSNDRRHSSGQIFTLRESLEELSELVGTAGLDVAGICIQKLYAPNTKTYVGSGKLADVFALLTSSGCRTIVVDDDLTPKQQRNFESGLAESGAKEVKVLDRTAIILDIFAQHAKSKEGQLQVELAQLEYRMTRGPKATGGDGDKGAGFRGPGESRVELDRRVIRDRIVLLKREIENLGQQRDLHRLNRERLGLPLVALVGYTNAGKSTLLNRLSRAGVLAENMLFATLDPTTRKVRLPRKEVVNSVGKTDAGEEGIENKFDSGFVAAVKDVSEKGDSYGKGSEVLLTDTVGFISKLPANLVAAFRATLEEVARADVLIHVIDRSSPVWEKQRETVMKELNRIGNKRAVIVELWNKIDSLPDPEDVRVAAACQPVDVEFQYEEPLALASADTDSLPILPTPDPVTDVADEDVGDEEERLLTAEDLLPTVAAAVDSGSGRASPPRGSGIGGSMKVFTVAASVKTGLGMGDVIAALEDALSTLLVSAEVYIPYSQDEGLVAAIHSQGAIEEIEYGNDGTRIRCRVSGSLQARLEKFRVK